MKKGFAQSIVLFNFAVQNEKIHIFFSYKYLKINHISNFKQIWHQR